ncbi:MAG TPA: formate/nitrite transporter family protein [Bacilli bacterium]|nr:formate/nitrite transporter family protein [Bacilli bacterium]
MKIQREIFKTYISGIYGGLCVVLATSLYLLFYSFNLRPLGSILFSVGLILIVNYGFSLYTGKIGYAFALEDRPKKTNLLMIFLGNATAAIIAGALLSLLRYTGWTALFDIVDATSAGREIGSGEPWYLAIIYGFFCGLLIFFAIHTYKIAKNVWVKYIGLIFFISLFVIFGMEHCIANLYIFTLGNAWTWGLLLNVAIIVVGNSLGGMFGYLLTHL